MMILVYSRFGLTYSSNGRSIGRNIYIDFIISGPWADSPGLPED